MRILVIVDYYKPDGGPAAPLYTMLCECLEQLGHEVTVVTSVPHYPSGLVQQEYRSWRKKSTRENGVHVVRVPVPSFNRSKIPARIMQFLAFQIGATLTSMGKDYDVMLTHSPALEVWLPFMIHAGIRKKPTVYSVSDVYPEVGIRSGFFKNVAVIKLVDWLEKSCLRLATKIRIISNSFLPELVSKGITEDKITLIYDWVDTNAFRVMPRENGFSIEHGLVDRFVVSYAGNIGLLQGLDSVLEAAKQLTDEPDICFVFVGEGGARAELIQKANLLKLNNVKFIPYQPRTRMPEILSATDVSLVCLRKGMSYGALPSKTYSILATGRPVIASVDPGSDIWSLIMRSQAGICIEPETTNQLVEAIRMLKDKPDIRDQMGRNGRNYVIKYHSPESSVEAFVKLFFEAVK